MNDQVICAQSKSYSFVNSTVLCSKRMLKLCGYPAIVKHLIYIQGFIPGTGYSSYFCTDENDFVQNFSAEMDAGLKGHHPIILRNLMGNLFFSEKSNRAFPFFLLYLK